MANADKILIVDDDEEILLLLSKYLKKEGFDVFEARDLAEFDKQIEKNNVDIVILDIMLPDGSGLEKCKSLRQKGDNTPIILLTAVTEEVDKIIGLEFGADDYIGKPFNPRELLARIRAVLRRIKDHVVRDNVVKEPIFNFDGFTCDPSVRRVFNARREEVDLTGAEFDLLVVFLERPQRLISREILLELTNKSADVFDTTINVLMSRIRKKMSESGASDGLFRTVRNAGYQLTAKVEEVSQ